MGKWSFGQLFAGAIACGNGASAQTVQERGKYLSNGILACGNCHTPKDASGAPIMDRELAGEIVFTIPPFNGTASNIKPK